MTGALISFVCYLAAAILIAVIWWIKPGALPVMLTAMLLLALAVGAQP